MFDEFWARGWRPTAFREFVLKIHQRCNLACDYCYVYHLADQSWRTRPHQMPSRVWRQAVARIAEHVSAHGLDPVHVVLHGGEPLLAGVDTIREIVEDLRATVPCGVRVSLQTNGVLLTEPTLAVLHDLGVRVAVSVDGDERTHDLHRQGPDGRGSHAAAVRALALLRDDRYRTAYAGLLCTVDVRSDPVAAYEALIAYEPPVIDFLLPHANWASPPGAPHADWLIAAFDRWYDAPRRETVVRLFESVVLLQLGGQGRSEQVGLGPAALVVVESDGAVEQVDALKSAYEGAAATGLHVETDPFDAALRHPGVVARQIGTAALSPDCQRCRLVRVCGGGHYAHRYRPGAGFRNPSVYCADLIRFIDHVGARVRKDVERVTRG
ncbi:FxsB family cyclophane-forming radical SAM/SPASM peptide maturase [Asanoa hainanensis]|nr:FxsB family cyclophane-forming radical SAM/SPASM peptide maturase [Asanoa hainanensis]